VQRAHDFRVEASADHQQKKLSIRTPQVETHRNAVFQRATHAFRIDRLLHISPEQVFGSHWHRKQWYLERNVRAYNRRRAIPSNRDDRAQSACFRALCGQAGQLI
jgi:hypothetical protein